MNDQERAQATRLRDDPEAWPDEIPKSRLVHGVHDVIVGFASAGWILFLLSLAFFSTGGVSRVVYGVIVCSFVWLSLAAFGSRRQH